MSEKIDHLSSVKKLLDEYKLVEHFFDNVEQGEEAEGTGYRRGLAELNELLNHIPSEDMVHIIEALSPEARLIVWDEVRDDRCESLIDILNEDVVQSLAWNDHFHNKKTAVSAFELRNGRLSQIVINSPDDLKSVKPIWIDLIAPTPEIRLWVGRYFGIELPNPNTLTDLETSARFYVEDNGEIHLHSDFLLDTKEESRNVAVALILHRDILFSVRTEELPVFRLQRLRARTLPGYVTDGMDVLLDLYAADAEYSADALQDIYAELGEVSHHVLKTELSDDEAAQILADIAKEEDLNGRIRRNAQDTRRAVSFLTRGKILNPNQLEDALQIMRDIESLDSHTAFLFGKINFLMDATVGFININQNKVIKIFSVVSVALLPPTLIASIYGMNFQKWFPELQWEYGYPFSLLLMALSVACPVLFFKKKGWLD